jgi:DNA-directed RNA polymerase specialized sigma24 family protein
LQIRATAPGATSTPRSSAGASWATARRLGTRAEDLEDACQEVFLGFFRHLSGFRGGAELKTWLFRLCVTEARRTRHRRKGAATLAAPLRREPAARPAQG